MKNDSITDADDPNEEFICGFCTKKLTGRFIFCSQDCEDKFEEEMKGNEIKAWKWLNSESKSILTHISVDKVLKKIKERADGI